MDGGEIQGGQRTVSCPACGAPSPAPWRSASSSAPALSRKPSYELLRCRACGSAALAEPEAESADLYERGTYSTGRSWLGRLIEPLRRLVDRDRRRLLGPLAPGSRVLEIGAGRGRLVAGLSARGHLASGIEPSPAAVAAARERGADVADTTLERADLPEGEFDLVVLWHVLEHLDDPAGALARARSLLADGGRIVVAAPNLESLQARAGKDRWFHQDVPRHRVQLTPAGLRGLLERSGFRPEPARFGYLDQGLLGMWLTLLNRLTVHPDVPFRFLKGDLEYARRRDAVRDGAIALVAGPLLVPVAAVLEAVAVAGRRGGAMVVAASRAEARG